MPCADCYRGHDHPGPVNGFETKIHNHDVYVAEPLSKEVSKKALIIVLSDAFGWNTTNLRKLADSYAERTSCKVYIPDFMYGTAAPASTKALVDRVVTERGLWGWLVKPWLIFKAALVLVPFGMRNNPEKRYPAVQKFMNDVRCAEGENLKVGVVGFCWGGYGATQLAHGGLASNGKTFIDAAFTAHPSELKVPEDIEQVKLPYSVVIGDVDFALPLKGVQQTAEILEKKEDVDSEVVIIPNAKHGFAVRGDPDNKAEMEMADQAEDQMVRWFSKHLV